MTLRILPLGNGFALVDTSTRQIFEPWFAYEDSARVFQAYVERFSDFRAVSDEMALAAAIEAFLVGLETIDLGVGTTTAQKLEAFLDLHMRAA